MLTIKYPAYKFASGIVRINTIAFQQKPSLRQPKNLIISDEFHHKTLQNQDVNNKID